MDENSQNPVSEPSVETPVDTQPENQPEDRFHNLKSEVDRKLANLNAQLAQQLEETRRMAEAVMQTRQPSQPVAPPDILDKPEEYAQWVRNEAKREALAEVQALNERNARMSQAVSSLASQYPEFNDNSSEAYRVALEENSRLPKTLQGTPEGAEMAMLKAIAKVGLQPASKRKPAAGSEDFSVSANSRGSGAAPKPKNVHEGIDPKTLAFAQMLGRNVNDPKVIESLKQASKQFKTEKGR